MKGIGKSELVLGLDSDLFIISLVLYHINRVNFNFVIKSNQIKSIVVCVCMCVMNV